MIMKRLHKAAGDMTISEATVKLGITVLFVPVPILALKIAGLWLDYYKLNTTPLFLALGAVSGSLISFLGVCKIITYGHSCPQSHLERHNKGTG